MSRLRTLRLPGGEPLLAAMVVVLAAAYALYSIVRHEHFESGFDLAIFDQAIWHLAHGREPASTVKGLDNLWGDHLHPIIMLLAPLRALWPSPNALLFAQAALVAASVVPVFLFARDRLDRWPALGLAASYGGFWGLQGGIGFEFHEVAFAPLLVATAILAADRERWAPYWVAIALMLLVKEDMPILVCAFGVWLAARGDRRRGAITVAAGIAWYVIATKLVIPTLAEGGGFKYWTYDRFGDDLPSAAVHLLTHPWELVTVALDDDDKRFTLLLLFAPFLFLSLSSRMAILLVPLLAERFLSSNTAFWGTGFHYSMTLAPILAMGAAVGLAKLSRRRPGRLVPLAVVGTIALLNAVAAFVIVPGAAALGQVLTPGFYDAPRHAGPVSRGLALVPPDASIAAQDFMVPHLTERPLVAEITPRTGTTEYLAAGLVRRVGSPNDNGSFRGLSQSVGKRIRFYVPIFYEDGWIVMRRRTEGPRSGGDGVLAPMTTARARAFGPELLRWQRSIALAYRDFGVCPLRGDADAAVRCFRTLGRAFVARQRRLDDALTALLPTLTGGCAQLATLARRQNVRFAADLEAARAAGEALDPVYLARAKTLRDDIDERDLPGLVQRFWLLCGARKVPARLGGSG